MNRLVETNRASNARRSEQAQRSHNSTRLIGEDVAEHVFGEDDVELGRLKHKRHGGRVDILVRELNIGKIAADARDDFAPESRALQHIRLVDGEHSSSSFLRELKCDARDALDLRLT